MNEEGREYGVEVRNDRLENEQNNSAKYKTGRRIKQLTKK
jgi:hypothetical protein